MLSDLRKLFDYRELLVAWIVRDVKVRYKQSLLGIAWAILQPLSLMVVFTVVFSLFVRIPTEGEVPYPLFSYTALLPWTFFAASISFAVPSLVRNMSLLNAVYFPREIFPLAATAASGVDFLCASLVFVGLAAYYGPPLSLHWLWIPLILVVQLFLTLGVAFFASAVNVFYRDVRFVVPLAMQLWMYATPVIYPLSLVPEGVRPFYMLNPMAGLIDAYRRVILYAVPPDWRSLGLAGVISLVLFVFSYRFFKRAEWQFADVI